MTPYQILKLRNHTAHFLSYEVARSAGLSGVPVLQQFVAGAVSLPPENLILLARRTGFPI